MERKVARNLFIWAMVVCSAVFIWLTIDTHVSVPICLLRECSEKIVFVKK